MKLTHKNKVLTSILVTGFLFTDATCFALAIEPEISADWHGATVWMGGVPFGLGETFNGSINKGKSWRGSNLGNGDYIPVRIVLETGAANQSLCQTFRNNTGASAGVGTFPGQAWDISDPDNPRRLNICFLENSTLPPANFQWDPDGTFQAKQEYLVVMLSSYDSTGTTYAGFNIITGATSMDILYAWYPRVLTGHTFFENQPCTLSITPHYIHEMMGVQIDSQIILNWKYIGDETVDHFNIYVGISSPPDSMLGQVSGTAGRYTHSGITSGLTYYFRLEADNAERSIVALSKEIIVPPAQAVSRNLSVIDFWNERTNYGGCWGYTDSLTGKEFGLLACHDEGVSIIDLSLDPIDEVAFLPLMTPNTYNHEVKVYKHYIIMMAEYEPAQIFDVSDITNPVKVAEIHHEGGSGAHNCMVDGDYLYIVGNHSIGGLEIFDITDPTMPVNTGDYAPYYYHDIDIYKDTLIAFGVYGNGMDILDITDKNIVTSIGHFNYPGSGAHNGEFLKGRQYVAIGDELGSDGNHTRMFDLRDLDNINKVADIIVDSLATAHNCYARNDTLFIAHNSAGVRMFDVSDPEKPTEIGFYDTFIPDEQGWVGAWTAYPYFTSGRIIVSDRSGGLFLLKPSPPPPCCIGNRGDLNGDAANANILDLTFAVDRIFRGGPPALCPDEADVNNDTNVLDILDLTFLVDRIFRGGPPPGGC